MIKEVDIQELRPGMKLGESVYNYDGTVRLLSSGGILTSRQIELLRNIGIERISVDFSSDDGTVFVDSSVDADVDTAIRAAKSANAKFDSDAFKNDLESIVGFEDKVNSDRIEEGKSVVNNRMSVNVITGENNIPLDIKHEKLIAETKDTFEKLRDSNELDFDMVSKTVEEALPDMIRNNDVLSRLAQLKKTDDYTFEHSFRVSVLATMIGKWLGYSKEMLEELASAALLFDIGKMKIPEFILKKPILNEDEMAIMKKHSQFGYNILLKTKGVTQNIKYSALQHHERNGGVGYPLKLNEAQVHEYAKIIMVCDIFDAMTNDRPYKKKVSEFKAAEYISWQSGASLDAKICYIFLSNLAEFFTGKEVVLSTGERGRIVYVDPNFPTRPTIITEDRVIDLIINKDIQIEEMIN